MPPPPLVLHRGTQSIPSTVKADLLFTQGMIPGEQRCREKGIPFFCKGVVTPLALPPGGKRRGGLNNKEPRKFSLMKAPRTLTDLSHILIPASELKRVLSNAAPYNPKARKPKTDAAESGATIGGDT
jgi:hypothetical protein